MRPLPPLAHHGSRWVLPMADRSAAVLAQLLLAEDPAQVGAAVARQLAADPPLVVWAVCLAAQHEQLRLGTVCEVAQWLGEHAHEALQWDPPDCAALEQRDDAGVEALGDLVAASLCLADLAAQVSQKNAGWDEVPRESARDPSDAGGTSLRFIPPYSLPAQAAYLAGLLHDAQRWFALVGSGNAQPATAAPWDWLENTAQCPASPHVATARAILSGAEASDSTGLDVQASRDRGLKGRQLWMETVPGAGVLLPVLAARMTRLARLEQQFQAALEVEKLEAMAEFAAGAGHEINNPLAIIAGRAQLLLKDEADPERRRELALINAQVKRAHEMIADLWLFARPPRPEFQTVDLVQLVDRVVEEMAPQAAQRGVSLRRAGEPGPLPVEADPVQLCVALNALLKNSLEAIGRDGQVEIGLRGSRSEVEIRVSDTGPGVTPDERRHIFDPFYSARQAGRGLGMGLSKCWRIVTGHGGGIAVESPPGQGAQFVITLPRFARRSGSEP
jgi:signal transduction histidine kinase